MSQLVRLATVLAIAVLPGHIMAQQIDHCRSSAAHLPSADLYCLELLTSPVVPNQISGHVILDLAPGPFTLAVDRDGVIRYRPRTVIAGLPDPATLGGSAYVAWAATPLFDRWVRLGTVHNGVTELTPVAFDQFSILVSVEVDSLAQERTGRIVMRGGSPSTRMLPPDFMEFLTGIIGVSREELEMVQSGHAHHDPGDGWGSVPMPPGFAMLPAEMLLRPTVTPWRLEGDHALPATRGAQVVKLADGDSLVLVASAVRKRIHGVEHTMLGFNGAIPGPMLWVERGTSVRVRFVNNLDQPSTIHWHGLRHDYRMDGVPGLSQDPVPPGGEFEYTLRFPDSGLYWYHPHVREEMQQDLGLSGNIVVRGMEGLPVVEREEILLLDDILISDDNEIVPYGREAPTHALMGRFGNILLVNGETRWADSARSGDTIRLWFTNAANTRTFNLSVTNAAMTLVAGDMSAYDSPTPVESVVLAPAERYAVDVTLHGNGPWVLESRVRAIDHLYGRFVAQVDTIGELNVIPSEGGAAAEVEGSGFRGDPEKQIPPLRARDAGAPVGMTPDLTLEFGLRTRDLPFVVDRMMLLDSAYFHPVEWSGTMPMMNWATTALEAEWFVRDAATGKENEAATFTVKQGEQRIIRLVNLRNTLHAMQHPIHLHGQRFRVLAVNGVPPPVGAWKDTVLLPAGSTVDILVEFTNPGHWMLHCHIAEHMEAGMMTHFVVE